MGFYGKRLCRRLRDEFGWELPGDLRICPCRPSWATRAAGGFSWVFQSDENVGYSSIGSQWTVRRCAMAPRLEISVCDHDRFIDPYDDSSSGGSR